jgi:hypothetical protein
LLTQEKISVVEAKEIGYAANIEKAQTYRGDLILLLPVK